MSFFDVFAEMIIILFAIALGYGADRMGILDSETDRKLCKLLLNFTMPAMILASVMTGDELPGLSEILSILGVGLLFYLVEILFMLVVPRFLGGTPGQKGVWRYTLVFPNVGFIGYPVAVALFGQEALFYAVVLTLPFNLLAYTMGTLMLAGTGQFRLRQMFTPCVVASLVSLVLALCKIRVPQVLGEMLDFVGDVTVPLSLLVVGSLLAGLPARQVFASPRLWLLSAVRLLVMPVALWLILRGMGVGYILMGVAVTQMAMPTAINGSMLCMEYGGDSECMAQVTLVTTLAATITIPIVAAILL